MRVLISILVLTALLCLSCEDILEVSDISNERVDLVAPSDSTTVVQSNVNFTWNDVYEASEYRIQVAAPDFENAAQIVVDTLVVVDSLYTGPRFSKNLVDSDYEWRVKAMNSGYETEYSQNQFTVETEGN